jgi:hypothetical protein
LLGAGADINARGDGDCTALQIAAFAGHANVIRSLLSLGGTFNINAPGGKHGSAMKAADDQGHFEAVTVLRKAGAMVIPKSPVSSESPDAPGGSEAEVAAMTGQTVENALETPRSPTEATGSSSPKTGEAEMLLCVTKIQRVLLLPQRSAGTRFSFPMSQILQTLLSRMVYQDRHFLS